MSTNFYLHLKDKTGNPQELHIGLRAGNSRFLFHCHKTRGLRSVEDWKKAFSRGVIQSEYSEPMTPEAFMEMVDELQASASSLRWWEVPDAVLIASSNETRYVDAQGYSFDARDFC